MRDLVIRPVGPDDRAAWEPLWTGYQSFYDRTLAPEVTEFAWQRLTTDGPLFGLLAIADRGAAVGLVHFQFF
jgi:hypothetical protein